MKSNIDRYYKDIRNIKLLTRDEEQNLAVRIQAGDSIALDTLVSSNLRFVISEARKYQNRGLDLEDLICEGNTGLIEAAKHFNPDFNFRFITYAVWWIRQAIFAALNGNKFIALPANRIITLNKVSKASASFERKEGREPSTIELAELTGLSHSEVNDTRYSIFSSVSISSPIGSSEEDGSLEDILPGNVPSTDNLVEEDSLKSDIEMVLSKVLSDREKEVIQDSFGIGREWSLTDEQIAENLEISPERVRQLREKALKVIRHNPTCKKLLKSYNS